MAGPNFELVTELQVLIRRDFPVATEAILNPLDANALVDGEWLELDGNYKLARGAGEGTSACVYPVHTERGRYDVQAIKKVNVLMLGMYEAESSIVDTTGAAVGDALTVQTVAFGGVNRRALKKTAGGANRVVVGYVTKVLTAKLRFVHYGYQKVF